jgi:type VI secretion system protein ImpC
MSNVAAASFAPFISAASAQMFGLNDYRTVQAARPRQDLRDGRIHQVAQLPRHRGCRFVNLVMPRTIARLPYGAATKPVEEFNYEEAPYDAAGKPKAMDHEHYCWMNAAYVMGAR